MSKNTILCVKDGIWGHWLSSSNSFLKPFVSNAALGPWWMFFIHFILLLDLYISNTTRLINYSQEAQIKLKIHCLRKVLQVFFFVKAHLALWVNFSNNFCQKMSENARLHILHIFVELHSREWIGAGSAGEAENIPCLKNIPH